MVTHSDTGNLELSAEFPDGCRTILLQYVQNLPTFFLHDITYYAGCIHLHIDCISPASFVQ